MAGYRRSKRGQGTKGRAPIFPIGPRRRARARKPSWRDWAMRLAGGPLWLLAGVVVGGLAVAIGQGWLGASKPHSLQPSPPAQATLGGGPPSAAAKPPAQSPAQSALGSVPAATPAKPPLPTPMPPAADTSPTAPAPASVPATLPSYEEGSSAPAVIEPEPTPALASSQPPRSAPPAGVPSPTTSAQTALLSPPPAPPSTPSGPNREPAWLAYAVPAPDTGGKPMVAIVIDDTGLDRVNSARVIALPGPLTISFMAYAERLDQQSAAARARGHELLLHVPMEPLDPTLDTGPEALRTDLLPDELRRRLDWDLGRLTGFVGINNHMGSKFSQSPEGMAAVMQALRARGLLFLDSRTIAGSVGSKEAAAYGVPYADRDVFLDNDQNPEAVAGMLAELERIARKRGYAIGIGHPHSGTIEALQKWLPTLAQRGIVLVPLSAIVRRTNGATG